MISYAVYKVIHYTGIFLLITALGATLSRAAAGVGEDTPDPWRKRLMAIHGTALFFVLLGGFGMLARLDGPAASGVPGWAWAKLGIWAALAGIVVARRTAPSAARALWLVPILAIVAGVVALTKPF